MSMEWDYDDFVYKFNRGESFCNIGKDGYSYNSARVKFWEHYQSGILPLLQRRIEQGWTPISEVGANAILLREFISIKWSTGGWIWFFLVTIFTMGAGLLMLFFGLSTFVEPVEFRVKLRRIKSR